MSKTTYKIPKTNKKIYVECIHCLKIIMEQNRVAYYNYPGIYIWESPCDVVCVDCDRQFNKSETPYLSCPDCLFPISEDLLEVNFGFCDFCVGNNMEFIMSRICC
jgi:hypothetical protein